MLPKCKYDRGKSTHPSKSSTLDLLKEIMKFLSTCMERPHISDKYDADPSITADIPISPQQPQGNPHVLSRRVRVRLIVMTVPWSWASVFNITVQC